MSRRRSPQMVYRAAESNQRASSNQVQAAVPYPLHPVAGTSKALSKRF
jgi:hypothetical protein